MLSGLGALAAAHHERLDGTGYHRGARAAHLPRGARLLAAADMLAAMTEDRPYRPGHPRRGRTRGAERSPWPAGWIRSWPQR
jgi:HD-GYP domain-containing protein (c-di-GMP phosphodiesterase class II)